MESLLRDIRHAARGLARSPGFAGVAILCLALGVGAATAIFSFADTLILRAAPYPAADRVVVVYGQFQKDGIERSPLSGYEYLDLVAQSKSLAKSAALIPLTLNLTGEGEPTRINCGRVSANLFDLLQVPPEIGRTFAVAEDVFGQNQVAILSYALWQRHFSGDKGVLGRKILLDDKPYEVVGVMPKGFRALVPNQELWVPIAMNLAALPPRTARGLAIVSRLAPDASIETLGTELRVIAERFVREHPESYPADGGFRLLASPIRAELIGRFRPMVLFVSITAALVLLIACANVASLLLARALAREREMALRAALGAGRGAIVRQLLVESTLLSLLGGAVGVVLADWALHALLATIPARVFPVIARVEFSGRALAFGLAAALLTGLIFGLAPALRAFRVDVVERLKEGSKGSGGGERQPLRAGLVIAQVALALAVLTAATLLDRSLARIDRIDPGFRPEGVLTAPLIVPKRIAADRPQVAAWFGALAERLSGLPGATSAGLVTQLPLVGDNEYTVVRAVGGDAGAAPLPAGIRGVSAGYFSALGIPLVNGRLFAPAEENPRSRVALVDEKLARALWPGTSPLGKSFYDDAEGPGAAVEVIGVVGPVRHASLSDEAQPTYYVPFATTGSSLAFLVVRTNGDPAGLARPLREAVRELDRDVPVDDIATMKQQVANSLLRSRLASILSRFFGGAALLLTVIGVYGLLAFAVVSRRRELGIRMALGESRGGIIRLVAKRSSFLIGFGLLAGVGLAALLARVAAEKLSSLLYGTSAFDLGALAIAAGLLLAAGLAATIVPAYRATRTSPVTVLRAE
ncbi:MAG TPA: ABC transporter permease [Thermoanaerobaculia bacterium]|nr:ABC transporter permease [Thermoanaerobaculia bacterium]